ncbi:MAG: GPR endopeptidase [Clostridiales bacterium]|nr:GPR endopeptidase [Clostridiales bacterium]
MKYRTDLAIECVEIAEEESTDSKEIKGVDIEEIEYGKDVKSTRIKIKDQEGARALGKPIGSYVTIEAQGLLEEREGVKEAAEHALATELQELIKFHYYLKVLVAGLGNFMVTPDALGPAVAGKIKVTRHLFLLFEADGDDQMSCVSCLTPGVSATTGMQTADIVKKAVDICSPELVIAVDSLAAKNIERVSTTIQITDTGISPGGGMGNNRQGICRETVGTDVIAIGVPTVIDATTIVRDSLSSAIESCEEIEEYVKEFDKQLIVTSTDIDTVIKDFSDIIANGINKTLHPGIYS